MVRDEHAARAQHEADRDVGQEVDEGKIDRDQPLGPHPRVPVTAGDLLELRLIVFLPHEGLRHANAGKALLEVRVHGRDALTGRLVGLARLIPEPQCGDEERRQDAGAHQGEARVHDRERDTHADERHEIDERVDETVL